MLLLFNSNGVHELKHTCPARVVITKMVLKWSNGAYCRRPEQMVLKLGPTEMVLKFHP